MSFDNKQVEGIVSEIGGGKVHLTCSTHRYVGGKIPPNSTHCADCWRAYYIYDYATTPPHMREQRLSELSEVIHKAAELEAEGKWDFKPAMPGNVKFEQDGFDDETGDYRKEGIVLTDD